MKQSQFDQMIKTFWSALNRVKHLIVNLLSQGAVNFEPYKMSLHTISIITHPSSCLNPSLLDNNGWGYSYILRCRFVIL